MDIKTGSFFDKMPQALPLYKMFAEKVLSEYPDVQINIQKSQIAFSNKHQFAFVWLPIRKMKNRPDIMSLYHSDCPIALIRLELWKLRNHIQIAGYIIASSKLVAKLIRNS